MDKTKYLAVYLLAALVTTFGFVLILNGREVNDFLTYVVTSLPVVIGVLFVSKQNDNISQQNEQLSTDVSHVKSKVNGELDARFLELHNKIDAGINVANQAVAAAAAATPAATAPVENPPTVNSDGSPIIPKQDPNA